MDDPVQPSENDTKKAGLTYEETPIIDPVAGEEKVPDDIESVTPEAARVFQSAPEEHLPIPPGEAEAKKHAGTAPPVKKPGGKRHIGSIVFIVLLFILGVWLSGQLRSFFTTVPSEEIAVPTQEPVANPTLGLAPVSTDSATVDATWVMYQPVSGSTKQPIAGISYKLPASVSAPVCDNASCSSQGTNLPGGTRFTVAPRGRGQLLPDFRGAILTDAAGREFTMKQSIVGGLSVYEYTGDFTGRTGGGYTFTMIRGALVSVSDTLAIEFNHFAPSGRTADFASDDVLFTEIIRSFSGAQAPVSAPIAPTATSSGF